MLVESIFKKTYSKPCAQVAIHKHVEEILKQAGPTLVTHYHAKVPDKTKPH